MKDAARMRKELHASWRSFRLSPRARDSHPWAACAFVLVSAALHVLMVGAVIWGEGGARAAHPREGIGANAIGVAEEAITTMFFVEDSSASEQSRFEDLASAGKVLQSLRVTMISPDSAIGAALKAAALDEQPEQNYDASAGEREARAALFGRYIGQMQARIERAWTRPRSGIGADLFECRVRVQQDARRVVVEVTLKDCNGDSRWQLSLVNAIQGASPLPAPPDPSVFANAVDLSFSSAAYSPGRSEQGFEPSTVAALNNTNNRSP